MERDLRLPWQMLHRVSLPYDSFLNDLRHPPAMPDNQLRQILIPFPQLMAWDADVCNLNDAFPNLKAIAPCQGFQIQPARREVLANVSVADVHALVAEELIQFFA